MEVLYKREVAGDLVGLIHPMLAKLRDFWRQAEDYQKFLYLIGTMLLISAVIHSVVLIATGGSLEGPVSWRKPILFAGGSVNKCVNRHQAAFSWVTGLTGTPLTYWAPW